MAATADAELRRIEKQPIRNVAGAVDGTFSPNMDLRRILSPNAPARERRAAGRKICTKRDYAGLNDIPNEPSYDSTVQSIVDFRTAVSSGCTVFGLALKKKRRGQGTSRLPGSWVLASRLTGCLTTITGSPNPMSLAPV